MTQVSDHIPRSTKISLVFDQLEFASRRVAELLPARSRGLGASASGGATWGVTSHAWCPWVEPAPNFPALLVSGEWNLSAVLLQVFFDRIDVWDVDAERAETMARVAEEGGMRIRVRHCPSRRLAQSLASVEPTYRLAALLGVLGTGLSGDKTHSLEMLKALAGSVSDDGQCWVIGRNPPIRPFSGGALGGWGNAITGEWVRRRLSQTGRRSANALYLHPDHQSPTEVLLPPRRLPTARRDQFLPRVIDRFGLAERMLGSYAVVSSPGHRSLIEKAHDRWEKGRGGDGGPSQVVDCVVRDNAMVIATVASRSGEEVILRVPLVRDATEALMRLDEFYSDAPRAVPRVHHLVPKSKPLLEVDGWPVHTERKCGGVPIRRVLANTESRSAVRANVLDFVNSLCNPSCAMNLADEAFAEVHYHRGLRTIGTVESDLADELDAVGSVVVSMVAGRTMPTVRIHGDLTVDNVFVDPTTFALTGVIDWETTRAGSLPFDFVHYLLSERRALDPLPWGELVARAVAGQLFDGVTVRMLTAHFECIGFHRNLLVPLLVGYWIRGVALRQTLSGGRLRTDWRQDNLVGPLRSIRRTLQEAA